MDKKITHDPYEDVLQQILTEVTGLRQHIEVNVGQRLQAYQNNYRPGFFPKAPMG